VENGDRSKPLLLFVHGFPEFWFSWRSQLKYFAKDYWVVALDMRGYGDSDKPRKVSAYKMETLKKDIVDFVKALNRNSFILCGHDWGGAIAWGVAASYPEMVSKLIILNAPHPNAFKRKIETSVKQFLKSWYIFAFQMPYLPELYFKTEDLEVFRDMFENKISEEELEGYKNNWSRKGAFTPPIDYYRNVLKARDLLKPEKLPKITSPVQIIWGENDLALERDLAEMCRPFVESLKIHYIPNANHFVQQDKPDEVNRVIEEFLNSN